MIAEHGLTEDARLARAENAPPAADAPLPGAFALHGGQGLWFPVLALLAFGILFVYSSSSVYASQKFGNEFVFVRKQFLCAVIAAVAAVSAARIPIAFWDRFVGKLFLGIIAFAMIPKLPGVGVTVGVASRWVSFGPLHGQPGEFVKIATILFGSFLLARTPHNPLQAWPSLLGVVVLVVQPDFGTAMIVALGLAALLFVHGIPKRLFIGGILLCVPVLSLVMVAEPYRVKRLVAFLDPFADPLGSGFQVIQSFVALASGGWFGKGLGGSQQKLFFLPEAHTDFILAVIGEEMGFAGILIIALIYGLLFYSILQIIHCAADHRQRLLATGIFAMLAGTTIVNMGVVAGVLPTKGLPLPFISSGGSALIANAAMMGLLAQIHKNSMLAAARRK